VGIPNMSTPAAKAVPVTDSSENSAHATAGMTATFIATTHPVAAVSSSPRFSRSDAPTPSSASGRASSLASPSPVDAAVGSVNSTVEAASPATRAMRTGLLASSRNSPAIAASASLTATSETTVSGTCVSAPMPRMTLAIAVAASPKVSATSGTPRKPKFV
jgi:hypothetical protein